MNEKISNETLERSLANEEYHFFRVEKRLYIYLLLLHTVTGTCTHNPFRRTLDPHKRSIYIQTYIEKYVDEPISRSNRHCYNGRL